MAYINGEKVLFSSNIIDGNGYYNKEETAEMLDSKADKVNEAIENNLASLDANGNLKDSGINTYAVKRLCNPNLLINPDFRINQRGFTTYNTEQYTVDRWKNENSYGTVTKTDTGITFSASGGEAYLTQRMETHERLVGKELTLSISINGEVYSNSGTLTDTAGSQFAISTGLNGVSVYVYSYTSGQFTPTIMLKSGTSISIEWVKFEVGSYATPYSPRPYAEELLLCQRYFRTYSSPSNIFISTGLSNGSIVYFPVLLEVPFRVTPTIDWGNINMYDGTAGSQVVITSLAIYNSIATNFKNAFVFAASASTTAKGTYLLRLLASSWLNLDAEIY